MISLLNQYLGIPLESLVGVNCDVKLDSEKREQLLNVMSIREYYSKKGKTATV